MDKVSKFILKLNIKDREIVEPILTCIKANNLIGLHVKKLKGYSDLYRVRKSGFRIVYSQDAGVGKRVILMDRRDGDTYKDL